MQELTAKQEEFLYKEFNIEGTDFTITRDDYESLPCPMIACIFTDEQMQKLADNIAMDMDNYVNTLYDIHNEDRILHKFWASMEENALDMGMKYYEDYSDGEIDEMCKDFLNMK